MSDGWKPSGRGIEVHCADTRIYFALSDSSLHAECPHLEAVMRVNLAEHDEELIKATLACAAEHIKGRAKALVTQAPQDHGFKDLVIGLNSLASNIQKGIKFADVAAYQARRGK